MEIRECFIVMDPGRISDMVRNHCRDKDRLGELSRESKML